MGEAWVVLYTAFIDSAHYYTLRVEIQRLGPCIYGGPAISVSALHSPDGLLLPQRYETMRCLLLECLDRLVLSLIDIRRAWPFAWECFHASMHHAPSSANPTNARFGPLWVIAEQGGRCGRAMKAGHQVFIPLHDKRYSGKTGPACLPSNVRVATARPPV